MYQNLLCLELIFLKFLRDLYKEFIKVDFRIGVNIKEITVEIETLEKLLQKYSGKDESKLSSEAIKEFETALGKSYTLRTMQWEFIGDSCLTQDLQEQFINLEVKLDDLIAIVNHCEPRTISLADFKDGLAKILALFQQKITAYIQSEEWRKKGLSCALELFFGASFSKIINIQKRIILMQTWLSFLKRTVVQIQQHYPHPDTTKYALEIKRLLVREKKRLFLELYKVVGQKANEALARNVIASCAAGIVDPDEFIGKLENALDHLYQDIYTLKQDLKKYGLFSGIAADGIYLWTESYHFKFAESYVTFLDEVTTGKKFRRIPILSTKLDNHYTSLVTALGSFLLLYFDTKLIGFTATSLTMSNTIISLLLSDLEKVAKLSRGFLDEKQIQQAMPYVEQTLGFGAHVCLYSVIHGFSYATLGTLTAAFLAAQTGKKLAGVALDRCHSKEDKSWNLFVKQPVQHVAFIASQYFTAKAAARFFQSHPASVPSERLLSDATSCLREPIRCRATALKTLGLPEEVTQSEITKTWHQLAQKFHPDRNSEDSATVRFIRISDAVERLKDLQSQ